MIEAIMALSLFCNNYRFSENCTQKIVKCMTSEIGVFVYNRLDICILEYTGVKK